jgi:hypothetical protein
MNKEQLINHFTQRSKELVTILDRTKSNPITNQYESTLSNNQRRLDFIVSLINLNNELAILSEAIQPKIFPRRFM